MLQRKTRKDAAGGRADVDLSIVESSSVVAAITVAADGTILAANSRMRRLLGLSEAGIAKQKPFLDHLVDAAAWAAWRDAGRGARAIEVELRCFNGGTKR